MASNQPGIQLSKEEQKIVMEEQIQLMLETAIARYCQRNGRHGETYLLEKGLRDGLIFYLTQEIIKYMNQTDK